MVNGRSRGVLCRLTIYAREDTNASHPMNITVWRIIFNEGIQKSSRLAILRVCNIYTNELKGLVFRLHPRASAVDRPARYPLHLAHFVAA